MNKLYIPNHALTCSPYSLTLTSPSFQTRDDSPNHGPCSPNCALPREHLAVPLQALVFDVWNFALEAVVMSGVL